MPIKSDNGNVLVWGIEDIDARAIEQAEKLSRLPFITGHVALMPDAHVGKGSTIGTVFASEGAIIPAAIGVDIGCGMAAIELNLTAEELPALDGLMPYIEKAIPAGVGKGKDRSANEVNVREKLGPWPILVTEKRLEGNTISQCGTLGSGNHFFEICLDERDVVWIVLHSGSRGVGNKLATIHIAEAKGLMKKYFIELEDPDLAYLVRGTPQFGAYITDMVWAQNYAALNREIMLDAAMAAFNEYMSKSGCGNGIEETNRINCHHNFTQLENHHGRNMWITRKGAIKAGDNDLGIIPGSMGTDTYITAGLGNPASYGSSSHGAGRRHSRTRAKEIYSPADLEAAMGDRVWNGDRAKSLVDEIPGAYKDIAAVMAAQSDLVRVVARLRQIFNYKG